MFKDVLLDINVLKFSLRHNICELFWYCNLKNHHFYVKAMI
jgi:hypothetical protein